MIDSDEPKPDSTIQSLRAWSAYTPAGAVNSFRPTAKESGFSNSNSFARRVSSPLLPGTPEVHRETLRFDGTAARSINTLDIS